MFGVSRQTATEWCRRADNFTWVNPFKDKKRRPKRSKITSEIEDFILFLRVVFGWGTGRIQQGLMSLPGFMYDELPKEIRNVKEVGLSRPAINNVLKKHGKNGYSCHDKTWKFFRAERPDQLWQLDLKGPVTIHGIEYYFIVCIDDYSRYLIVCLQLDHCPTTEEIANSLKFHMKNHHPDGILTDNGGQFRDAWKRWCKKNSINPLFAHPYYPQDKGKVERTIRNVAEEFTNLLQKFPNWLDGKIKEFQIWYNNCRIHRGIKNIPKNLYVSS